MNTSKFRGSFTCTQEYVHCLCAGFLIRTVNKLEGCKKESLSCLKWCHQDIQTPFSMQGITHLLQHLIKAFKCFTRYLFLWSSKTLPVSLRYRIFNLKNGTEDNGGAANSNSLYLWGFQISVSQTLCNPKLSYQLSSAAASTTWPKVQ